jgi:hopene-associated glycosyltransferase HpnB
MSWPPVLAALSLALWLCLLLGRSGFWQARLRIENEAPPAPRSWPPVVIIVPARNEAEYVETALRSLLAQNYPGALQILLVDDHSNDATGKTARRLAKAASAPLEVLEAAPLPPRWSGKLWAVAEGLRHAAHVLPAARYVLLTDADVAHPPCNIARLVAKAEAESFDLVSLMVMLRCERSWERVLIPPFVFFFQKLYPFAAVNDATSQTAAAAGGCMLVRSQALHEAGGIEVIRDRLIDDIALAQAINGRRGGGRLWLGLTATTVSLRGYDRLSGIWDMVARSADTQLGHSSSLLIATVLGMTLTYLVPPAAVVAGVALVNWSLLGLGLLSLSCMSVCYLPTVRLYRLAPFWILSLPLAALLYIAMTIDSAICHRRGAGGHWKDRMVGSADGEQSGTWSCSRCF